MTHQGSVYTEFVRRELAAERERRNLINTRGMAVVTSSASLVAVLIAVVALVSADGRIFLPLTAKLSLVVALAAFSAAAIFGLNASRNVRYEVASTDTLKHMSGPRWTDDEVDARNNVLVLDMKSIDSLRTGNERKAAQLTYALIAQSVALAGLGLVILFALL